MRVRNRFYKYGGYDRASRMLTVLGHQHQSINQKQLIFFISFSSHLPYRLLREPDNQITRALEHQSTLQSFYNLIIKVFGPQPRPERPAVKLHRREGLCLLACIISNTLGGTSRNYCLYGLQSPVSAVQNRARNLVSTEYRTLRHIVLSYGGPHRRIQ